MRFILSRHLAHFNAVYDAGSLRAAASEVGLSQAALSKSLHQFEHLAGLQLFDRTSKGLMPTPWAHVLRQRARVLGKELDITQWELDAVTQRLKGHLKVCVGPVWNEAFLPEILPTFLRLQPGIRVTVSVGSCAEALNQIREGHLDIYLGVLPTTMDDELLQALPMLDMSLGFFARPSHPVLGKRALTLHDMRAYPWIGFSLNDRLVQLIDHDLGLSGEHAQGLELSVPTASALGEVVVHGDHLAVVSDAMASVLAAKGVVRVPLQDVFSRYSTGMVCRGSLLEFAPAREFRDVCQRVVTRQKV
ncbi:LysR family transcriptional regulator [Variovorax rhizosphaerae]|uniref:LysR family transcriptional regulator n=1 Tax=Variovorax rhizosphaerae TaxID=1836200 RepID=A0ABU8WXG1_9BURK